MWLWLSKSLKAWRAERELHLLAFLSRTWADPGGVFIQPFYRYLELRMHSSRSSAWPAALPRRVISRLIRWDCEGTGESERVWVCSHEPCARRRADEGGKTVWPGESLSTEDALRCGGLDFSVLVIWPGATTQCDGGAPAPFFRSGGRCWPPATRRRACLRPAFSLHHRGTWSSWCLCWYLQHSPGRRQPWRYGRHGGLRSWGPESDSMKM